MLLLTATTNSLQLITTSTSNIAYHASYVDITTSAFTPGSSEGIISSATTTTIVSAPGASTQRQIKMLTLKNTGSSANSLTLQKDVSATDYELMPRITLSAQESITYIDGVGFQVFDSNGNAKSTLPINQGTTGRAMEIYKVGTAPEAAGVRYCWSKDSGSPGAWATGSPGLAGRTTDGTTTTDAGCVPIWTPTGSLFLTGFDMTATVACQMQLIDVLWVNTGAVVTTLTAQTVNSVTLPARDLNGSTNGEGIYAGILVTGATTNVGAVTNTTLTYTNSDNVGSRTATMASFPATAVVGTFVPFQLAGGDRGIRSIQSVTLGTSYAAGSISLIMYRQVATCNVQLANVSGASSLTQAPVTPGIRLFNGSCLLPFGLASATTATTIMGTVTIMER